VPDEIRSPRYTHRRARLPADLFPADATWAGVLLILVGGLFLAALAVGIAAAR
jgi:hypothetical protein